MHKPLSYQLRPQPFELGLGVWGSVLHEEVALRLAAIRAEGWRQVEAARAGEAKAAAKWEDAKAALAQAIAERTAAEAVERVALAVEERAWFIDAGDMWWQ